jgi:hypothetical protein
MTGCKKKKSCHNKMTAFEICKEERKRSREQKGKAPMSPTLLQAKSGMKALLKSMSIVIHMGRNVKEYKEKGEEKILQSIKEGQFRCSLCLKPMNRHSSYHRRIKETGQEIEITMVWCSKCREWHALLPDFLLPNKHYSGNEIESVIIDSECAPVSQIDTEASESTVRRWVKQIGERIRQAVSVLKYLFMRKGKAVSEALIEPGHCYSELEQILEMAPSEVKCSGNKFGLANIWLGTQGTAAYI